MIARIVIAEKYETAAGPGSMSGSAAPRPHGAGAFLLLNPLPLKGAGLNGLRRPLWHL
jgi:hypothetical protein